MLVRFGGASAVFTIAGALFEKVPAFCSPGMANAFERIDRWSNVNPLPNSNAPVKAAPGTRPELTPLDSFFRMDLGSIPQGISEAAWNLRVSGLVERNVVFRLSEIRKLDPVHQFATLACITNPVGGGLIGTTRWTGVSLQRLLQEVKVRSNATHLKIRSADGYHEIVPLSLIRRDARVMLAYDWDGLPLSAEHGFPLRLFVPDVYGMKQPKWIRAVELIGRPEKGYWGDRGWDDEARIRAMAVMDTGSRTVVKTERGRRPIVQLGGIAFAGARGISSVQIQVDRGAWQDAELRQPMSELSWVLWRFDWPFQAGRHSLAVRCFESNGKPQMTGEASPYPSGSTGIYRVELKF